MLLESLLHLGMMGPPVPLVLFIWMRYVLCIPSPLSTLLFTLSAIGWDPPNRPQFSAIENFVSQEFMTFYSICGQ